MLEIITESNINKYLGYLTDIHIRNAELLGFDYGGVPVGSCMIQERGLSISVDSIYIEPMFRTQIIEELMVYLVCYADDKSAQIIEVLSDDSNIREALEGYGFTFRQAAVSYECTVKEMLMKEKLGKILSLGNSVPEDYQLLDFNSFETKYIPENIRWILQEPDIWKEVSSFVMKDKKVKGLCAVEKTSSDGKDEVRLSYLYSRGPKYLPMVIIASTRKALEKIDEDSLFTFSAINKESIQLAEGIGFTHEEIRSTCDRGLILMTELRDYIYLQETMI